MSQLESLPPAEKRNSEQPKDNSEQQEGKVEVVPGTSIKRRILIASPVTIAVNGVDKQYNKVPAIFVVLRDIDTGLYEIGNEEGQSFGFVEKKDVFNWNIASVYIPNIRSGKGGEIKADKQPTNIFPVFEKKGVWNQVGKSLTSERKDSSHQLMLLNEFNEEDKPIGHNGIIANRKSIKRFHIHLKGIHGAFKSIEGNKNERYPELLDDLKLAHVQFITRSNSIRKGGLPKALEHIQKSLDLPDVFVYSSGDLAKMDKNTFDKWLLRLEASANRMGEISEGTGVSSISIYNNGQQQEYYVIPIDQLN
jgi:hypothetical protein